MNSLEVLRKKRAGFAGGGVTDAPVSMYDECERIYRAAFERVCDMAGHVDRANALSPEPSEWEFSEAFWKRHDDMILAVDTEWLQNKPDIDRFKSLVSEWEEFCRQELRNIYTQISGAKTQNAT